MSKPQLLSGARGLIQKKDKDGNVVNLALATDISINVRENVATTFVIGSLNPVALDPTAVDVDVSIGRVVPVNRIDAAEQGDGLAADSSQMTAISLGLEHEINQSLTSDDITIAIQDKITGKFIASVHNCRFAGRSMGSGAEDVASERLNFVGIYDSGYEGENSADIGYGV